MKLVTVLQLLLLLASAPTRCTSDGVNGGGTCAGCTIVVALVEQLAAYHNRTVVEALDMLCDFLPSGIFREACNALVDRFGATVIDLLEKRETPDVVCLAIGLCSSESGDTCHLYPPPSEGIAERVARIRTTRRLGDSPPKICDLPGIATICAWIERFADQHDPLDDVDADRFSTIDSFRGASWGGKDCDDIDSRRYPGRRTIDDAIADTNCNGIYGRDPETGRTYEEMWCNGTGQYGTLLLGDSVGAHFHLPPAWLNVTLLDRAVFDHLVFIVGNELDWPQHSATTGHLNISLLDVIDGPVDSIYLRLFERNRCNHRDYQNIGVNGARASAMADDIVKAVARNPNSDHPLFVTYELVGNDVCNGHPGTEHMTTPEEFYAENKEAFEYLDLHLPAGSKMVIYGIVDGRVLFDSMHDRIYPIGALRNDVTYAQFYTYLNCLGISPCFGWMNVNETMRNVTWERAIELNEALRKLIGNITLRNIEIAYVEDVISLVIDYWKSQGGETWQLIEPSDGFHSNQLANALSAKIIWEKLISDYPNWFPPINPNNQLILNKFGDQGGY